MTQNNSLPYEIIAAPFTVWWAPVGSNFPDVEIAPPGPWTKIGSSGDLNYSDEGVTVAHSQEMELFRALGDAGSRKAFRVSEDLIVRLQLADVTLEQYKHALNGNTVTDTPPFSNAGHRSVGLSRGFSVQTVALLVRGPSPYMDDGVMQFEIPRAAQTGNPEVVFKKGDPAMLALEWTALVDPDATSEEFRFGRLKAQDSDPAT